MVSLPGLPLASGAFIDFRLTTSDPNHLTLQCFSSLTGDVDRGTTIFLFSSPSADPVGSIISGGTFDITPMNEAFFHCISGRGISDFSAISGKLLSALFACTFHFWHFPPILGTASFWELQFWQKNLSIQSCQNWHGCKGFICKFNARYAVSDELPALASQN